MRALIHEYSPQILRTLNDPGFAGDNIRDPAKTFAGPCAKENDDETLRHLAEASHTIYCAFRPSTYRKSSHRRDTDMMFIREKGARNKQRRVGEVVEGVSYVGAIGSQRVLPNLEGTLVELLRLVVPALLLIRSARLLMLVATFG